MQPFHNGPAAFAAHAPSVFGRMAADLRLNRIQRRHPRQQLGRDRRFGRGVELVKSAPHVRPAERELHRFVRPLACQALEARIAVHLQHAVELGQMPCWVSALAVLRVDIGGDRVGRPAPGPVIHGIAPPPPCLGAAAAGVEHRQRNVVGEQLAGGQRRADHQVVERRQPPAGAAHPLGQRRAVDGDALARQHLGLPI